MHSQLPPEIVMIGHLVKEMIYFPDRTIGPVLGSPPAYCSAVAAKLGVRAAIVTKIGPDMPADLLCPLSELDVDLRGMRVGGVTTTTALIYDANGNKEIRYPQKAGQIAFEDIPPEYLNCQAFHICPMDHDVPLEAIRQLSSQSAILSVDLGGYGGAHSVAHPDPADPGAQQTLREVVQHSTIVRASIEDCRHLFGSLNQDLTEIVRRFVEWGAQIGLVTLGTSGVVVATRGNVWRIPALPGNATDSTGAGDAFSAGFLVEYLHTHSVLRAAQFASAVALHVIEGTGGVRAERMPSRADVERRLQAVVA